MWQQTSEESVDEFCRCEKNAVGKTRGQTLIGEEDTFLVKNLGLEDPRVCPRSGKIISGLLKRVNKLEDELDKKKSRDT